MKKPPLRGKSGIPYSHLSNDYLHCTQEEIAEELGVSQQYVQQVEKRALVKFKKRFCSMYPDTWKLIQDDIGRGYF